MSLAPTVEDRVGFDLPDVIQEFLPGLKDCAAAIRTVDTGSRPLADARWAAGRVEELDVPGILPQLGEVEGPVVLFHAGSLLGAADLPAAWQGLSRVSGPLLGVPDGEVAVLTPAGPTCWVPVLPERPLRPLWAPGPRPPDEPAGSAVVLGSTAPVSDDDGPALLPGLPHGGIVTATARQARAALVDAALPADSWARCHRHLAVLMLGLLDGACRRLTEEAFAYARQPRLPAVPLAAHQAVGIRLGGLAAHQQALHLMLQAAVEVWPQTGAEPRRDPVDLGAPVTDWATRVAQEGLQVAAAHGYVAGLPFRSLVEQVGTLIGSLARHRAEYRRCLSMA